MSRQRAILLALLGASVMAAALGSLLFVQVERVRSLDGQIALLRKQYLELPAPPLAEESDLEQRTEELERARSDELARYYEDGEMDLYRFSSLVSSLLARRGIAVDRLRTLSGSAASVVELSARGAPAALMAFLADVSARPKYWTIPYLHVQSPPGERTVTCQMQIGYLVHEDEK